MFTDSDLALFSKASGDRNPLHLSPEYASRTSYGAQVVFGALGALAALGGLSEEQSRRVRGMQVDFLRPMFLGVDYRIKVTPQENGLLTRLFDGTSTVVSVTLKLGEAWPADNFRETKRSGMFPRAEAVSREEAELVSGLSVSGRYGTDQGARAELCRRWGVSVPPLLVDMLLWSSYTIGMEMPGKTALFSRFTLDSLGDGINGGPFDYEAVLEQVDKRLGQMRIRARLWRADGPIAAAECRAFNRLATPALNPAALAAELPPSNALAHKRALVIGASRGLGAAMAHALASQGATVVAVARSGGGRAQRDLPGKIEYVSGDATDPSWRAKLLADHGSLDLLISNAFPALLPLSMEANTCARIEEFMSRANAMTIGPLCSFLPALSVAGGSAVLISSIAVEQPVKEWPHYVAAKRAAEALTEVAALQYPNVGFLVVRAERMLTEMTNTPMGRRNAVAPELVAARVVQRLVHGVAGWQIFK